MIYTEKETHLLYDVQFISDFVLVRPASPDFSRVVRKLTTIQFADEFEEFCGVHEDVEKHMRGADIDIPEASND